MIRTLLKFYQNDYKKFYSDNYRSEIDGLRSLSIILVLFYHYEYYFLDSNYFSGGYLGVDIFFVISGYLIFKIIYKEIKNNNFNYFIFLFKRARRILPVLLLAIIIFKILIFSNLIGQIEKNNFINESIFSSLFISNIYYYYNDIGYGDIEQFFKHTWSLGVEEQFYLFIPLLSLFIIAISKNKYFILAFFILISFFSLGLASYYLGSNYNFVFFNTLTRAWDLLLGVIVFLFEINFKKENSNKLLNFKSFISFISFIFLLTYVFFIADISMHPSFYTLFPLTCVCIILLMNKRNTFLFKMLSFKPVRFIGIISYSIYIWHFPILIMMYYDFIKSDTLAYFLTLTFLTSIVSYHFIEVTFRRGISNKVFIISMMIIIIFFSIETLISKKNIDYKITLNFVNNSDFILNEKPDYNLIDNLGNNCLNDVYKCEFNDDKNKKIIVIGDSLIATNLNYFYNLIRNDFDMTTYINNGCLLLKDVEHYFGGISHNNIVQNCNSSLDKKIRDEILIEKNKYQKIYVIYLGRYQLYSNGFHFKNYMGAGSNSRAIQEFKKMIDTNNENDFLFGLESQLNFFKDNLIETILIYPIPEMGFNTSREILIAYDNLNYKNQKFSKAIEILNLNVKYDNFLKRSKDIFELFDSHKNNVYFQSILPHEYFCDKMKNLCFANDENWVLYADESHLSNYGSKLLFDDIFNKLKTK